METTENEHRTFELNALRNRQPAQFHDLRLLLGKSTRLFNGLLSGTQDKNLQFLYTHLMPYLMVNRWSPLTHAVHCMTTSIPAAATQNKSKHNHATGTGCASCRNSPYSGLEDWLRICWLTYPEAELS